MRITEKKNQVEIVRERKGKRASEREKSNQMLQILYCLGILSTTHIVQWPL